MLLPIFDIETCCSDELLISSQAGQAGGGGALESGSSKWLTLTGNRLAVSGPLKAFPD